MATKYATPSESGDYSIVIESGEVIGTADLSDAQFRHYCDMSGTPEGWIRLGELPHDYCDLAPEFQGTHEDTTVYIRPE